MRVSVVVALPDVQEVTELDMEEGARVSHALETARVALRHPWVDAANCGIWGRPCTPDAFLREGDRVEVYRPLRADAKALRKSRAKRRRR